MEGEDIQIRRPCPADKLNACNGSDDDRDGSSNGVQQGKLRDG